LSKKLETKIQFSTPTKILAVNYWKNLHFSPKQHSGSNITENTLLYLPTKLRAASCREKIPFLTHKNPGSKLPEQSPISKTAGILVVFCRKEKH
jgi:hypothetical protein